MKFKLLMLLVSVMIIGCAQERPPTENIIYTIKQYSDNQLVNEWKDVVLYYKDGAGECYNFYTASDISTLYAVCGTLSIDRVIK